MKKFNLIMALLLLFGLNSILHAQIALSPSFVFVDENSGVGNLYLSNNSDQAYEITINFSFGYPGSDADGNMVMNYEDSTAYNQYALDDMIRAFPRSFIINGSEQRTVRIQVIPGERRKEGFYFTRMKVLAKPQTADITELDANQIGSKITFNFEQITAVFYHKGKVNTGLIVKGLDIKQKDQILELRPHLERTGNSPFLGSMFAKLKDKRGNVVAETQNTTTVYFDEIRRMDLKLEGVLPGTYTIELSFETRRNDMMIGDLVQSPRIVNEATVEIK